MTLFSTAYFPSVSYMARFLKEETPIIEVWDTYHKQTYRNRCRVMTANGVESLSVPVIKVNGRTVSWWFGGSLGKGKIYGDSFTIQSQRMYASDAVEYIDVYFHKN